MIRPTFIPDYKIINDGWVNTGFANVTAFTGADSLVRRVRYDVYNRSMPWEIDLVGWSIACAYGQELSAGAVDIVVRSYDDKDSVRTDRLTISDALVYPDNVNGNICVNSGAITPGTVVLPAGSILSPKLSFRAATLGTGGTGKIVFVEFYWRIK